MKYVQKLALFLIMLVLSMTFVFAADSRLANSQLNSKDSTQTLEDFKKEIPSAEPNSEDGAGEQCIEKHKKGQDLVDTLDNGVLTTLNTIFVALRMICKALSIVDMVFSTIASLFGDEPCCVIIWVPVVGKTICKTVQSLFATWENFYRYIGTFCCVVNCKWCQGENCFAGWGDSRPEPKQRADGDDGMVNQNAVGSRNSGGTFDNSFGAGYGARISNLGSLSGFSKEFAGGIGTNSFSVGSRTNAFTGESVPSEGFVDGYFSVLGSMGINPFENIYSAALCLCIPGIIS